MRKHAQMYYITSVKCMAQYSYLVIQSERRYNTLKAKITLAVGGLQF